MYFGLLSLYMAPLFSIKCLVLVILFASLDISCVVICLFIMSRAFPRPCLLIDRLSSVRLYSFRISTVLILHRLFLWVVNDLFSEGPFFEYPVGLYYSFLLYHPFYWDVSSF